MLLLALCSFIVTVTAVPTSGASRRPGNTGTSVPSTREVTRFKMRMPNVVTTTHDQYMVAPFPVKYDDVYIIGYDPVDASSDKVHHLLLYGCEEPARTDLPFWDIGDMGGICAGMSHILWAWALDAPKLDLPPDVGFHVGRNPKIKYLMLQIHYKNVMKEPDTSGIDVLMTAKPPANLAGIYLFATGSTVISPTKVVNADTTCMFKGAHTVTPFAFRTHTHLLGRQVTAWRERDSHWTVLGTRNPRLPQMFYRMDEPYNPITKGDVLHARCVFDGRNITHTVRIGGTNADEMCNFYMMYYMKYDEYQYYEGCYQETQFKVPEYAKVTFSLDYTTTEEDGKAPDGDKEGDGNKEGEPAVITNTTTENKRDLFVVDRDWKVGIKNGQVGGLSHTSEGHLVVFHRGANDWSAKPWFNDQNEVLFRDALIPDDVIVFVNPKSGDVVKKFGGNTFIMPHGVYVAEDGAVWVTDVALHQIMRYPANSTTPDLILGEKFVPGDDKKHFCKPTGVVVDKDQNVYVSDGYCNSRVIKFTRDGEYVAEFGGLSEEGGKLGGFFLVHDLSINHEREEIYVADREHGQIHVMNYNGSFARLLSNPSYTNIYSVEYTKLLDTILAVNISTVGRPSMMMALDKNTGEVSRCYPSSTPSPLTIPHTLTYIPNVAVFIGEISSPFTIWQFRQTDNLTESEEDIHHRLFFNTLISHIPISFVIVVVCLAGIPLAYLGVVLIFRFTSRNDAKYDRNGFQKLLRDYDSSDESEDDLVFKNSKLSNANNSSTTSATNRRYR